jgi:prepilin-type N-terminal cleavage/methylation domain-containing protein
MRAQRSINPRRRIIRPDAFTLMDVAKRDAFTLMEVVVAVIIVGMTSVATLSAFATELRTAETSRSALEAASLGGNRIALLELIPAEDLLTLPDSSKSGRFEPPFESYEWAATVTKVVNETDLFDARVRVTWANGSYAIGTRMYRPLALGNAP